MQHSQVPSIEDATPITHVPETIAPYVPTKEILIEALDDDLICSALYKLQDRAPLVFDKTFFEGYRKMSLARLHARDGHDRVIWVHPKLLSTLLHICSKSDRTAEQFLDRMKAGQTRGVLEHLLQSESLGPRGKELGATPLTSYLESIPTTLAPQLRDFARIEKFRQEIEELEPASMPLDDAFDTLVRLAEGYKLDTAAASNIAAIARGVLPVRQNYWDADYETRLIYAMATLVDPDRIERPTPERVEEALVALKAERLGRIAGVLPMMPFPPTDTLISELAHAFRDIASGKSRRSSIMAEVEQLDARFTQVADETALTMLLQDGARTRHIPDEKIAGALQSLIGTSAFLRETISYSEMPGLMTLGQRILGARGIDTRITSEGCRLHAERTVKRDWLSRASRVRRVRRYGEPAGKRSA